jgi:hypothetical protein
MASIVRRRRFALRARPAPKRICFHGEELEFSEELRYLLADEAATAAVGEPPAVRSTGHDPVPWKRAIATALNLFAEAGRGWEGYRWLVTPNADLGDERPLTLIRRGRADEVIRETEHHLSRPAASP